MYEPFLTRPVSTVFGAPVPSALTCSKLGIDRLYVRIPSFVIHFPLARVSWT